MGELRIHALRIHVLLALIGGHRAHLGRQMIHTLHIAVVLRIVGTEVAVLQTPIRFYSRVPPVTRWCVRAMRLPYWGKPAYSFQVMRAISQSRPAILIALYRDTALYRDVASLGEPQCVRRAKLPANLEAVVGENSARTSSEGKAVVHEEGSRALRCELGCSYFKHVRTEAVTASQEEHVGVAPGRAWKRAEIGER